MISEKEQKFVDELLQSSDPEKLATAFILSEGLTRFHWEMLKKAIDAGIQPSDFAFALLTQTYATIHSLTKLAVRNMPAEAAAEYIKLMRKEILIRGISASGKIAL